jgi:hypothetical protein
VSVYVNVIRVNPDEKIDIRAFPLPGNEPGLQTHRQQHQRMLRGHHAQKASRRRIPCRAVFFCASGQFGYQIPGLLSDGFGPRDLAVDRAQLRLKLPLFLEQFSMPAVRLRCLSQGSVIQLLKTPHLQPPRSERLWAGILAKLCIESLQFKVLR